MKRTTYAQILLLYNPRPFCMLCFLYLFVFATLTYKHGVFRFPTLRAVAHRLVATVLSSWMMLCHSEIPRSCVEELRAGNQTLQVFPTDMHVFEVNIFSSWLCRNVVLCAHSVSSIGSSPVTLSVSMRFLDHVIWQVSPAWCQTWEGASAQGEYQTNTKTKRWRECLSRQMKSGWHPRASSVCSCSPCVRSKQ